MGSIYEFTFGVVCYLVRLVWVEGAFYGDVGVRVHVSRACQFREALVTDVRGLVWVWGFFMG